MVLASAWFEGGELVWKLSTEVFGGLRCPNMATSSC